MHQRFWLKNDFQPEFLTDFFKSIIGRNLANLHLHTVWGRHHISAQNNLHYIWVPHHFCDRVPVDSSCKLCPFLLQMMKGNLHGIFSSSCHLEEWKVPRPLFRMAMTVEKMQTRAPVPVTFFSTVIAILKRGRGTFHSSKWQERWPP